MNLVPVIDAILSVLPLDDFTDQALFRSTVGENPEELHDIHQEMLMTCKKYAPNKPITALVGNKFYDRVKKCHAIVSTSEPCLYANLIIRKGVIYPSKME